MDPDAIDEALAGTEWRRDGDAIQRTVQREFADAIEVIGRIGAAAERLDHHPDIHLTEYRTLTLCLWTWAAGGVTRHDLELAREIDEILDPPG